MSLTEWAWLAFAIFGPVPLVWAWKWWRSWRSARNVRDVMEYRRQKFGGAIREPGQVGVRPAARPD